MRVTIGAMGSGGDGIGRDDAGRPLYVPFALPGETVEATPLATRGEGRMAALDAVLDPSPDRVAPPCAHFGTCGGCALQHWAPAPMAAWKAARVADGLSRAGFPGVPVAPAAPSPPRSRRRADLALRRLSDRVLVGFHARGGAEVVDLAECHVLHPALFALLPPLRELLLRLTALRRAGSAVLNLLDTGPDLLLRTDGPLSPRDRATLAAFGTEHGLPRIAWAPEGKDAAEPEIAAQSGPVRIALSGVPVAPHPGAFLQATPEGEAAIVAACLDGLPKRLPPKARIADLHAGLGTLSFALAQKARVDAFEGSAPAAAALDTAARAAGGRVKAARRDLARQPLLPPELRPYGAVVLDPPFAGAPEQVPVLARGQVPRVVYVSCNPTALARDARAFSAAPGWRVERAVAVDQFLWSAHVEAVVTFAREA